MRINKFAGLAAFVAALSLAVEDKNISRYFSLKYLYSMLVCNLGTTFMYIQYRQEDRGMKCPYSREYLPSFAMY